MHNTAKDCWVSFLGGVYNVTEIVADSGVLAAPILKAAGTDISHWFDAKTGDIRFYVCPDTNIERPYLPQGDFVDVPPFAPRSDYDNFGTPWWKDSKHRVRGCCCSFRPIYGVLRSCLASGCAHVFSWSNLLGYSSAGCSTQPHRGASLPNPGFQCVFLYPFIFSAGLASAHPSLPPAPDALAPRHHPFRRSATCPRRPAWCGGRMC